MTQKLTALSYLRSSRGSLTETLESQRHDIKVACKRLGIQLLEEFTDEKLSTVQSRPGLNRLLDRIRTGERVDFILVRSMSRLTRKVAWFIRFDNELKQIGTDLLTGPDYIDRSTSEHFISRVREIVERDSRQRVRR